MFVFPQNWICSDNNGIGKKKLIISLGIAYIFLTGVLLSAVYERDINAIVDTLYFVMGLFIGVISRYAFLGLGRKE